MGKQIEALKYNANLLAQLVHIHARAGYAVILKPDFATLNLFEAIDAAQERGLAATRRADEANHLVLIHLEIDAAQHAHGAKFLFNIFHFEERHVSPLPWCGHCRAR